MKVQQIPVDKCIVPEVRVTAVYDDELQALLSDSIEGVGQLQPITVLNDGENYIVTDGKHRLEEARRLGKDKIDAVVYQGDAKDAMLQNLVLNRVRGKTRASEMVTVINSLYTEYNLGIEEIVKNTGFTRDYIERLIKIAEASPLVRDFLDRELIGVGVAFEISRLPSELQQDELVSQAQVYSWTVKYTKEQVDEILRLMQNPQLPPPPPPPAGPRLVRCELCHQEHQIQMLKPVACCPDCYSAAYKLSRERAERLQAEAEVQKE